MNSYALPPTAMNVIGSTPAPANNGGRPSGSDAPDGFARMLDKASAPPAEPTPTTGSSTPAPADTTIEADGPAPTSPDADTRDHGNGGNPSASEGTANDLPGRGPDRGSLGGLRHPRGPGVLPAHLAIKAGPAQDMTEAIDAIAAGLASGTADTLAETLAQQTAQSAVDAAAALALNTTAVPDAAAQPGVLPAEAPPAWDTQALAAAWGARPPAADPTSASRTDPRDGEALTGAEAGRAGRAAFGQIVQSAASASAATASPADAARVATLAGADSPTAVELQTRSDAASLRADAGGEPTTAAQASLPRLQPLQGQPAAQGEARPTLTRVAMPTANVPSGELQNPGAAQQAASSSEAAARNGQAANTAQAVIGNRRDSSVANPSTAPAGTASTQADSLARRLAAPSGEGQVDNGTASGASEVLPIPTTTPAELARNVAAQAAIPATLALSRSGVESTPGNRSESASPAAIGSAGTPMPQAGALAWVAPAVGSAVPANASVDARLSASPGTPEFAPQLAAHVTTFVRDGLQHARLELNPAEMGPLTVQIQLEGNAARVHLAAENAQTRQALEQAMPQLAGSLRENGLTLSGGGVFEQPRQAQQQTQDGSAGQTPRGRDERDGRNEATASVGAVNVQPARRRAGVVDLVA